MKIKLILPLILLFLTQSVLIFLVIIIFQNSVHTLNIDTTYNSEAVLVHNRLITFMNSFPYLNMIALIIIFTLNTSLLILIYKSLNKKQMQIIQAQLKFDSLLNALKKFISHDIRKPLNLSKMLNSSLDSNKPLAIIKGIAGEIEKSTAKIEGFSDNVLIYCNYLSFKLEEVRINDVKCMLIDLLKDEKNIIIDIPENNYDSIEINKLYFTKSIINLILFLKNKTNVSETLVNFSNNKFTVLFKYFDKNSKENFLNFISSVKNEFEMQVIELILKKNNCIISFTTSSCNLEFQISLPGIYSLKGKQYG